MELLISSENTASCKFIQHDNTIEKERKKERKREREREGNKIRDKYLVTFPLERPTSCVD